MEFKKKLRRVILHLIFILSMVHCGGQGTEVVSVPNPIDTAPTTKKFEMGGLEVSLDVPQDWTFIDYTLGTNPGSEAFQDIDPETITVAYFSHGTVGFFTIFSGRLTGSQTLTDYIRQRRPSGDIQIEELASDGQSASLAFFEQEEAGPRGGYLFDIYLEADEEILWMRTELLGSDEERQATWDQFWGIVDTIKITKKGGAND